MKLGDAHIILSWGSLPMIYFHLLAMWLQSCTRIGAEQPEAQKSDHLKAQLNASKISRFRRAVSNVTESALGQQFMF